MRLSYRLTMRIITKAAKTAIITINTDMIAISRTAPFDKEKYQERQLMTVDFR